MSSDNMWRKILLSLLTVTLTAANPISSPEIASNSGKSTGLNLQEAQLNSLNAYAVNYSNMQKSPDNTQTINSFKPSYKIPQLENNFLPILKSTEISAGTAIDDVNMASVASMANNSPVLMQYLPQLMNEGGMQYLQLIPTRPLIVPISPFINGASAPPTTQTTADVASYSPAESNSGRSIAGPNKPHNNSHGVHLAHVLGNGAHYTYVNSQPQNSRNGYRINREIKGKQPPPGLSLNINEFIPLNPEAMNGLYIRGRP